MVAFRQLEVTNTIFLVEDVELSDLLPDRELW